MQRIKRSLAALLIPTLVCGLQAADKAFRPPAVPLITHDPYFSIWSFNDQLYQDWPRHWTGAINGMCGLIRIDGKTYRYMGQGPDGAEGMQQTSLEIFPTRTVYQFETGGIRLTLT